MNKIDLMYLNKTIILAKKAAKKGDFPVGALIVKNNRIVSEGYNLKEKKGVATYHAEIIAIQKACKKLKTWHLEDCTLYTSLEPCIMCCGAIIQSRIGRVVYASVNESFGAVESRYQLLNNQKIKIEKEEIIENVELLKSFFVKKRK